MDFLEHLRVRTFANYPTSSLGADALDLQGWVNAGFDVCLDIVTEHLRGLCIKAREQRKDEDIIFFEVGTWKGASASCIVERLKAEDDVSLKYFVCIDTWLGAPEFYTWGLHDPTRGGSLKAQHGYPTVFHTFANNMKLLHHDDVVAPFPISSAQAVDILKHYNIKAHGVYIDGSHEYHAVLADLNAYMPLVVPGGIMWGDDYEWVQRAVNDFCASHRLSVEVHGQNWLIKL